MHSEEDRQQAENKEIAPGPSSYALNLVAPDLTAVANGQFRDVGFPSTSRRYLNSEESSSPTVTSHRPLRSPSESHSDVGLSKLGRGLNELAAEASDL